MRSRPETRFGRIFLYIHFLDPLPSDLGAKEVWEIVLCLGTILRQWELDRSILFSALDLLREIVKKVIAKELVLNSFYCAGGRRG